jgi:hypothetical protein
MSDYEGMYDRLFERYTELQAEIKRLKEGHEEILTCDSTTAVWVIQNISKRALGERQ